MHVWLPTDCTIRYLLDRDYVHAIKHNWPSEGKIINIAAQSLPRKCRSSDYRPRGLGISTDWLFCRHRGNPNV